VSITHNLIYGNYYSGLRVVSDAYSNVVVANNTFFHNGVAAAAGGKSELNLDDEGSGANTKVTRNIISTLNRGLNDCYDSAPRNYVLVDNDIQGSMPTGGAGNCVSQVVTTAPVFANAAAGDFHTSNLSGYGAYAP
jgi:hypothetical protein